MVNETDGYLSATDWIQSVQSSNAKQQLQEQSYYRQYQGQNDRAFSMYHNPMNIGSLICRKFSVQHLSTVCYCCYLLLAEQAPQKANILFYHSMQQLVGGFQSWCMYM